MIKWRDREGRGFAKWKPASQHLLKEGGKHDIYIYIYTRVRIIRQVFETETAGILVRLVTV